MGGNEEGAKGSCMVNGVISAKEIDAMIAEYFKWCENFDDLQDYVRDYLKQRLLREKFGGQIMPLKE